MLRTTLCDPSQTATSTCVGVRGCVCVCVCVYVCVCVCVDFIQIDFATYMACHGFEFFKRCEAFSYSVKHRKNVLSQKSSLDLFDFLKICFFKNINIKFTLADQNLLKLKIFWFLSLSYLQLKTVQLHATFAYL